MRITGTTPPHRPAGSGQAQRAGGGVFVPETGGGPQRAVANAPVGATAGIGALLALQGVEDATVGRRRAVRRGASLLDALEAMKADLLVGRIGEGRLNQMMALLGQAREATIPGLDALIDDIELRARVELAKLGRFPA